MTTHYLTAAIVVSMGLDFPCFGILRSGIPRFGIPRSGKLINACERM